MNLVLRLIIVLALPYCLKSQQGITSVRGAKSLSLGNVGASFTGIDAIFHNPAGLVFINDIGLFIASEQRFLLSDVNASSMAMVKKIDPSSTIGILVSNFGTEEYKEQKIGLSYARKLADLISIGVQFDYLNFMIDKYGSNGILSFEIGVFSTISKELDVGFYVFNPLQSTISEGSDLSTVFRTGLAYHVSGYLSLYSEISKTMQYPFQIHVGIDYSLQEKFSLRIGSSTEAGQFHFGIAYNISQRINFDGGFSNHPNLGVTPALSISYSN